MSATLAKLAKPHIEEDLTRERLFHSLDEARKKPMVWICSPGGAGKTHLISTYIESRQLPAIWYHLDSGDIDVATLFYYLRIAAERFDQKKTEPLPSLHPHYSHNLSPFTLRFFEELFVRMPNPSILVLDNLQDVTESAPLYSVLLDAVSRIPEGINLVVTSRRHPPPLFTRLRVSRRLHVLGWEELRFSREEFEEAARVLGKVKPDAEIVANLHESLEGWIAGLVLSLERSRLAGQNSVHHIDGATRDTFNFFATEIWNTLEQKYREFLAKCAYLSIMTGNTVRQLTGISTAEDFLSDLAENNMFTLKLPPGSRYRFHNMFREFLLRQSHDLFPAEEIRHIRMTAASLLSKDGFPEKSADLLLQEGDWDAMISLVRESAKTLFIQGRTETILGWLERIPNPIMEKNPWLIYWQAQCNSGLTPLEKRSLFKKAYNLFHGSDEPIGTLLCWAGRVNTYVFHQYKLQELDNLIAEFKALQLVFKGNRDPYVNCLVTASMFMALVLRRPGDPESDRWRSMIHKLLEKVECANLTGWAQFATGLLYYYRGDIRGYGVVLDKLRRTIDKDPRTLPFNRIMLHSQLTAWHWFMGDTPKCLSEADKGLRINDELGGTEWEAILLGMKVGALLSEGRIGEAKAGLERLYSSYDKLSPLGRNFYHQRAAWLFLIQENPVEAAAHASESLKLAEKIGLPDNRAYSLILMAEVHLALPDGSETGSFIRKAAQIGANLRNELILFHCALLKARLNYHSGREGEGDSHLACALKIARTRGYANWHYRRETTNSELLARALARGIETEYVRVLIRKLNLSPADFFPDSEGWPWLLKICTLGRFELIKDGSIVRFTGKVPKKPLDLLKAIIALGGQNVAMEKVIEALWPDSSGDAGHATMETTLHRLRNLLDVRDAIGLREGKLSINPRVCWVDVHAFEGISFGSNHMAGENSLRRLETAVELFKGPFLPDDDVKDWTVPMRERTLSRYVRTVKNLGAVFENNGEHERAIALYLRALEICPVSETVCQGLMTCLEKAGRKTEALDVFYRYRKMRSATLGSECGKEILSIYHRLST